MYWVNGIRLAGTVKQHAFTVIPPFSLPERQGKTVSLWAYKHRQPVVLLFCADAEASLLRDFARQYRAYVEAGAERLAILPASPDLEEFPFPVLIDQDRHLTTRLVECTPAVWILDSFNELSARFESFAAEEPPHGRILNALAEIELRCPECGVPEWPPTRDDLNRRARSVAAWKVTADGSALKGMAGLTA